MNPATPTPIVPKDSITIKLGLKERIASATTTKEISALLTEGAGYTHASPSTQRTWHRVAARRTKVLQAK